VTFANLSGANLKQADLTGVFRRRGTEWDNFREANLKRANLTGANLREANLFGANLTRADLSGAVADNDTKWPEGFDPVAAGVTFE
jgi:uncharacterized protein YjbI with pentapeptide repeats